MSVLRSTRAVGSPRTPHAAGWRDGGRACCWMRPELRSTARHGGPCRSSTSNCSLFTSYPCRHSTWLTQARARRLHADFHLHRLVHGQRLAFPHLVARPRPAPTPHRLAGARRPARRRPGPGPMARGIPVHRPPWRCRPPSQHASPRFSFGSSNGATHPYEFPASPAQAAQSKRSATIGSSLSIERTGPSCAWPGRSRRMFGPGCRHVLRSCYLYESPQHAFPSRLAGSYR